MEEKYKKTKRSIQIPKNTEKIQTYEEKYESIAFYDCFITLQ